MNVHELVERLERVVKTSNGWDARCPGHDDRKASLSVAEGAEGKILLRCHAGCELDAIVNALGLEKSDLFAEGAAKRRGVRRNGGSTIYTYVDASGATVMQVVRGAGKKFFQRRPDGHGGWENSVKGVDLVPYHLDEVIKAGSVWIVEGEKDADRLRAAGLVATCNPMGAGKWRKSYSRWFADKHVAILPDNDPPGRKHAADVALSVHTVAKSVRVVELDGLPPKGDVSDWLDAGHTVAELRELVNATAPWLPRSPEGLEAPPAPPAPGAPKDPDAASGARWRGTSDVGNSQRYDDQHGEDMRWWYERGRWIIWDGRHWRVDEGRESVRRAVVTAQKIFAEAADASRAAIGWVGDECVKDPGEKLRKHARASHSSGRISAMIELAKSLRPVNEAQLDADPMILTVANGTIDLKTGELREHRKSDLCTRMSKVAYDPKAECPLWLSFLRRIMLDDDDMIEYLQTSVGYSLTGVTSEQCLWFCHGNGSNGKSTFNDVLQRMFGEDLCRVLNFGDLDERASDSHPTRIARLAGARVVFASESGAGRCVDEVIIKQLTGGDRLAARYMGQDFFEFDPKFKLWIAGNYKPIIKGTDEGIWRRVRLVPFDYYFEPGGDKIKGYKEYLFNELPGILRWAVEGCLRWQKEGLVEPQRVIDATRAYRCEMDIVGSFLDECCVVGEQYRVGSTELYNSYQTWCEENGTRAWTHRAFALAMKERRFEAFHSRFGRGWLGVGLISAAHQKEPDRNWDERVF